MCELVRLASLGADDAREFLAAATASRALHEPFVYLPRDAREFRAYLAVARPPRGELCALRRADGALVGAVALREIGGQPRRALLGFYAFLPWARRGLLYRGVALALANAFERHGAERVLADVQPDNHRARALLLGLGFAPDGSPARALRVGDAWRAHERLVLRSPLGLPGADPSAKLGA